jgi:5-methylcytosine-specific restriction endonuclease McrA
MRDWSLKHVGNAALVRDLQSLAAQDCVHLAKLLAHLGEVHDRKLFREAAQPSMYAYCINVLRFSEDAAGRRIHVAGVARRIPALLDAIAEGRLHLSGACEIAAHLTPENAAELLAAVTHKTREQIRVVVAALAPRPDLEERVTLLSAAPAAAAPVDVAPVTQSAQVVANAESQSALAQISGPTPAPIIAPGSASQPPVRVTPRAPDRYGVRLNIDSETKELLEKAKALLGVHGNKQLETVFRRALESLVRDLEKRKCGKSEKPRAPKRPKSPHTISMHVKQEVYERDQGQCTFTNEEGRRCPSRGNLEYEHIHPKGRAALEGRTAALTAADVRLLCHEHNQLMTERFYGATFIQNKRDTAAAARMPAP